MDPQHHQTSSDYTSPPNQPGPPSGSGLRKRPIIIMVTLSLLLLGIIGALVWTSSQPKLVVPPPKATIPTQEIVRVSITKGGFLPSTIQIKKGTIVTWTNDDKAAHWVASDPHPTHEGLKGLDSEGPLAKGDSYSYTFETPGTYTYHDHLNPLRLHGTVVVE